jgi:hypothetical protein
MDLEAKVDLLSPCILVHLFVSVGKEEVISLVVFDGWVGLNEEDPSLRTCLMYKPIRQNTAGPSI